MLKAFSAPGKFWRGNIHGHSDLSDGAIDPAEVCRRYKAQGYDFIALTDHFLEKYDFPVADTRGYRDEQFTTILGAEVHAPETSHGEIWHILAVGLPLDFAPTGVDETGPQLARRCAAAGAFVAVAHPQWYQIGLEDALSIDVAHAVEVYNHINHVNCDRGDGAALFDQLLARGKRLGCIAADDSHWKADDAFGGWVMVKATENTPEALLEALKAGQYYATQGPLINNITRQERSVTLETSAAQSVMLVGLTSCSVWTHGRSMTRVELPLDRFQGGWCRAVVVDAAGRRAWSNPLWLDT